LGEGRVAATYKENDLTQLDGRFNALYSLGGLEIDVTGAVGTEAFTYLAVEDLDPLSQSVSPIDDAKANNLGAYVNHQGTSGVENQDWSREPNKAPAATTGPSIDEANAVIDSRFRNPRTYSGDSS
jgi:hypothetical protein